jgi:hypothetical protein
MVEGAPQEARRISGDLNRLAAEFDVSLQDLVRLYDVGLNELTAAARIRTFLPILVTRRIERLLRRFGRVRQNRPAQQNPSPS